MGRETILLTITLCEIPNNYLLNLAKFDTRLELWGTQ